jgi:hypothetical protein
MTTVPSGGGGAGAGVGAGVGTGVGVGVRVGVGVGVGVAVGLGAGVAVGQGVGVAVPLGLATGAGLGFEVGADGGCGVGVGGRGALMGVAWCNCLVGSVVAAEGVGVGPPARAGRTVGTRVGCAAGGTAGQGRSARWAARGVGVARGLTGPRRVVGGRVGSGVKRRAKVAGGAWVGSAVGEAVMPHATTNRARKAPPASKAPHVFRIPALGAQPWGGLLPRGAFFKCNPTQIYPQAGPT